MTALKTVAAVIAGFLLVAVGSSAIDALLHATGVYPPPSEGFWDPGLNALALAYRLVLTVAGGWLTAALAPTPKMRAVWALAILGQIGGLAGLIGTWNMNLGPHWYPILLAVTAIPTVWLGGWLRLRKQAERSVDA